MSRRVMKTAAVLAGVALAWGATPTAHAQGGDAILDLLIKKGVITQREANEVREQADQQTAQAVEANSKLKVASWIDAMKWSGDFRLRNEYIDNNDQTNESDRWRFRYRLRLGVEMKFVDWATIGARLASGGDDPVSTNQSFENTFSRKSINIDLAYVTLQAPGMDWISVTGGKMKNPMWAPEFASSLIYDGDVTPEGLAEQLTFAFGDKQQYRLFANLAQFALDEVSTDENDPYMVNLQTGMEVNLGTDPKKPWLKTTVAGGYLVTQNVNEMGVASGSQPAGSAAPASQSTSPNRGNATQQPGGAGTTLYYLDDFELLYVNGEIVWQLSERSFLKTPAALTFGAEYLHNMGYGSLNGSTQTLDPDQTDGFTAQVKFGKAKKQGEWEVAYQYKYLEADATWDAITDSDWGLGGTDRKGHVFWGAYNVREWWQLSLKAFITEKISDRPNSGENTRGQAGTDLTRIQFDSAFKF